MDINKEAIKELDEVSRRKYKARRILRFIFLGFIILLVCYSVFYTAFDAYYFVDDKVNNRNQTFIKLCDRSYPSSKKIYNDLGIGEQTVLVNDYAFLGQHLALSQYQIDGQVTLEHQLSMRNVCSQSVPQDVAPLIDLTKLEDGDYVFSTTVGEEELFLSSELVISDSIILMPNLDGGRRTATIKALPENKTVVLSIRKYNGKVKRPDIVINPQGNPFFIGAGGLDELLKKANPHLKVVLTNVEEEQNMTRQLKDIAALEPVMAVSFASSLDLSVTIMDFDNTPAHPLIRELGGKVTGAISCEQGVANSCDLVSYRKQLSHGIKSFVFSTSNPAVLPDSSYFIDFINLLLS